MLRKSKQARTHEKLKNTDPVEYFIQRAYLHLRNEEQDKFNAMLTAIEMLTEKLKSEDYKVEKGSKAYCEITNLFKEARFKISAMFADPKEKSTAAERLNHLRFRQACLIENMKESNKALAIFDSLAKHATGAVRWAAMNARTSLLHRLGRSVEALASANELIDLYQSLPEGQKPSRHRLEDAYTLKNEIKGYDCPPSPEIFRFNGSLATSHFTKHGKPVSKKPEPAKALESEGWRISPLVSSFVQ